MIRETLGLKLFCIGLLYMIFSACDADRKEYVEIVFLLPPGFEGPLTLCPCDAGEHARGNVEKQTLTFDLRVNQSFCSDYLFDVKPWPLETMVFKRIEESGEESVIPQSFRSVVEFRNTTTIDSSYVALRYLWRNSGCLTFYVGNPRGIVGFYDRTWPK